MVAVAVLAVLAGCGSGFSGTTTPPTPATPAPVPTDADRTAGFAPGVHETGIYDADALVDAHFEALANTSYTVRLSSVRRYPNGSLRARHDRVLRVSADDRFHYVLTSERPGRPDRRVDRWQVDGEAYAATTVGNNTTYRSLSQSPPPKLVTRGELIRLFRFVPARVTDRQSQNGTVRYRVAGGPRNIPPLSNVSYVAVVSEAGRINSYRVSYATSREDRPRHVLVNATFSAVGTTTVDPPRYETPPTGTATDDGSGGHRSVRRARRG